ncbi:MAG: hypothetical protein ACREE0_21225, partial [Phenylobacterium sp.]
MKSQNPHRLAAGLALAVLALGTAAGAHPPAAAAPAASTTKSLQGNDAASWIADPHMHAFYDTTVAAFAQGPAKV